MTTTFLTGLIGSIVLVIGSAWPSPKKKMIPIKAIKNILFAIGNVAMLLYAWLNFQDGGHIFFVILEILVLVSTLLMIMNTDDRIDTVILSGSGIALIIWSLFLFEDYSTIIFILGLVGLALGFAFEVGTRRRDAALTLGSLLIAIFSYLEPNWIFFWLNAFFALFSGYYWITSYGYRKPNAK